jgi:hypothetical protein
VGKTEELRGLNKRKQTELKGFSKVEGPTCDSGNIRGSFAKRSAGLLVDRYVNV